MDNIDSLILTMLAEERQRRANAELRVEQLEKHIQDLEQDVEPNPETDFPIN